MEDLKENIKLRWEALNFNLEDFMVHSFESLLHSETKTEDLESRTRL